MGATIKGSVGKGGKNDSCDVEAVQNLLNNHVKACGFKKLKPDGKSGNKTISAIRKFQTEVAGFKRGDGRVDAGKNTFKALGKSPGSLAKEVAKKSAKKSAKKHAGRVEGKTSGVKKELLEFLQAVADHYEITLTIFVGKYKARPVAEEMLDNWSDKLRKTPEFKLLDIRGSDLKDMNNLHAGAMNGDDSDREKFLGMIIDRLYHPIGHPLGLAVVLANNMPAKARAALKTGLWEYPVTKGLHYDMVGGKPPKVTDKFKKKWKK